LTTLALIAVALKIMTPPGFMISQTGAAFPLVICTGHMMAAAGPGRPYEKQNGPTHDAPCAFAGHAVATPPTSLDFSAPARLRFTFARDLPVADLAPGRGLAAPPPPSHAPPL
jgi:hypothetical protein